MEQTDLQYQAYDALPGHVMIGGDFGNRGTETPSSRMILNLKVRPCAPGVGDPTGPAMDIAVALTIPQVAWIVQEFFSGIIGWSSKKNIYRTFLIRMMRKRWSEMTSPAAKFPEAGLDWVEACRYPEIPR